MESYKLVLPEHLNHYGHLFGGNMLKWIDEVSWIAASRDFPFHNRPAVQSIPPPRSCFRIG